MAMSILPFARTPLYHWHTMHNARFMDSDGWRLPAVYSTVEKEVAAARAGVGLADISAFAKMGLLGMNVPALTQALLGDSPAAKPRGVSRLTLDRAVHACRLNEDDLLLLASTTNAEPLASYLANLPRIQAAVQQDLTPAFAGVQLIGPHVEGVLRQVTPLDVALAALPEGTLAETSLAGVQALLVRLPDVPMPTLRVYVSWDLGEYLWDVLLQAGRGHGLMPVGLEALRALITSV